MSVQEEAHSLLDRLSEGDLRIVNRMLRGLVAPADADDADGLRAFLAACPEDDEPYTEDEQREDTERLARYRRGETQLISHAEVMQRTGGARR